MYPWEEIYGKNNTSLALIKECVKLGHVVAIYINSLLDFYINSNGIGTSNYVIFQDYIKRADQGDVRVLMLNGETLGAMRRIPRTDNHRSNVITGGSIAKHILTKNRESAMQTNRF